MPSHSDTHGHTQASTRRRAGAAGSEDALALLRADHDKVLKMFEDYDRKESEEDRTELAQQICQELTVHTMIEEEIFYPAVREALENDEGEEADEMMDEAQIEHNGAKQLIADIQGADASDDMFNARVKVLSEYIKHHVREEQDEMFPAIRKTDLDLKSLGEQLRQRKEEILGELKAQ